MAEHNGVRERMRAYLLPRAPKTEAERDAFERAVEAQAAYEASAGIGEIPGGVTSFTVGSFSATVSGSAHGAGYTRETISPVAWACLRNAGLIAYELPTARRA